MSPRAMATPAFAMSLVVLVGGCGARTGLLVGADESAVTPVDGGVSRDGPADHATDTSPDSESDSGGLLLFHCSSAQPGWSPDCPNVPPVTGTPCGFGIEGIQCEYGDDANIACNTVYRCQNAEWQLEPVVPPQFCGHGQCPGSYAEITNGSACATGGLLCAFEDGACACDVPSGLWICGARDHACPYPRPSLGCPSISGLSPEAGMTMVLSCPMLPCGYLEEDEVAVWQTRMTSNVLCGQ